MAYCIYKATNQINQKIYIGFTKDFERRRRGHLYSASQDYENHVIFHKTIRKYGASNFNWEIIYQHWDGDYCLNIMEPLFIKTYNSYYRDGQGYNMTFGGGSIFQGTCSNPSYIIGSVILAAKLLINARSVTEEYLPKHLLPIPVLCSMKQLDELAEQAIDFFTNNQ